MRGTMKISESNSLLYLNKNYTALNKVSNQISSYRKVVNLSDDPMSANLGIQMETVVSRIQQYDRNIVTGKGMLTMADQTLLSAKTLVDKLNSLTIGAASESTTAEQRRANANEVNNILQEIITLANRMDGERYIFGGQQTTNPPFKIVNGRYVLYTGDDKDVKIQIDQGVTQPVNVTGSAAFGSMQGIIVSRDQNPTVDMGIDRSTFLSDLNGGNGVPKGKILVKYSAYPDGLEVDLSSCDTLEDVKDVIEKATLDASRALDPRNCNWLDSSNMNWHDLQDRYVKVTLNPDHNGISLQEIDLGEPLPEPTPMETYYGLNYTINPNTAALWAPGDIMTAAGPTYDQKDYVYGNGVNYNKTLSVDEVANNRVAAALGIKGTAGKYDPLRPDPVLDGFLIGTDLNPKLTGKTLLANLEGYNDVAYTITNGALPGKVVISETSSDSNNVFNNWNLSGLELGQNTGVNGELYARATHRPKAGGGTEIFVELYRRPVDSALASDLVATGVYDATPDGGLVVFKEANYSGVNGTVGVHLPIAVDEFSVNLKANFDNSLRATVHVPAFKEEINPDGTPKDFYSIFSGWSIRGLDKPISPTHSQNHLASTDLDGNVSMNFRVAELPPGSANYSAIVELYRPSFADQPTKLLATGTMQLPVQDPGPPPVFDFSSGRIEFVGSPEFPNIDGSVYLEIPGNVVTTMNMTNGVVGSGSANATQVVFTLGANLAMTGPMTIGGAMQINANQTLAGVLGVDDMKLAGDTVFKKGQVFTNDVGLPNGGTLPAGVPLPDDTLLWKGTKIGAGTTIMAGTVLPQGQTFQFANDLAAGTVIPRGSYTVGGFPVPGMLNADPSKPGVIGFDVQATFATVDDLCRAVNQTGTYVTARVADNGKSIEFISNLAGAYLTVSEDTDCYEQMGDIYQQLRELDFNGLIKGVNSDENGNLYTEVIFYPPDPQRPFDKIHLVGKDGNLIDIDPGYYVRVYNSREEMEKKYEDRDNTKLMAEGFLPASARVAPPDPLNPFVPGAGAIQGLALNERNQSGLSGVVGNFDYYGSRVQTTPDPTDPMKTIENPYNNNDITIYPGGMRPTGSVHTNLQQIDLFNITPGITCDYNGTFHGTIGWDAGTGETTLTLFRDISHTKMTAKGVMNGKTGTIDLYETLPDGTWRLDANNNRIPMGSIVVQANHLLDGQKDNFELTTGAQRAGGQVREDNLFATFNDIIDAMHENDVDALHDLIGMIKKDLDRLLDADGYVGALTDRLNMLKERHADEIITFTRLYQTRVGLVDEDFTEAIMRYQASQNAFDAALAISGKVLQKSLLDYL